MRILNMILIWWRVNINLTATRRPWLDHVHHVVRAAKAPHMIIETYWTRRRRHECMSRCTTPPVAAANPALILLRHTLKYTLVLSYPFDMSLALSSSIYKQSWNMLLWLANFHLYIKRARAVRTEKIILLESGWHLLFFLKTMMIGQMREHLIWIEFSSSFHLIIIVVFNLFQFYPFFLCFAFVFQYCYCLFCVVWFLCWKFWYSLWIKRCGGRMMMMTVPTSLFGTNNAHFSIIGFIDIRRLKFVVGFRIIM